MDARATATTGGTREARASLAEYRALARARADGRRSRRARRSSSARTAPRVVGAEAAPRGDGGALEAAARQPGLRCAAGRGGAGLPGAASPDRRRRRRRRDARRAERSGRGAGPADPGQSRTGALGPPRDHAGRPRPGRRRGFRGPSSARSGKAIWQARIQVGKPYRQTPIFKSKIDDVVFNPTWTVPPGILAKDILPAVTARPRLSRRRRASTSSIATASTVDPSSIDWAKQTGVDLPLHAPAGARARQRARAASSSSSRIRYLVYLHDTPSKALFEKDERAFSSGCMRVQRPLELAALLLDDPEDVERRGDRRGGRSGRDQDGAARRGRCPSSSSTGRSIPAVEGQTVFKRDPYDRDPRLAAALDRPSPATP